MSEGFVTGWCSNGDLSNHHLCHHVYDVRERQYVCTCPCHAESARVHRVARRSSTNGAEPQEATEAPQKRLVQRRPVQRRQVRRV